MARGDGNPGFDGKRLTLTRRVGAFRRRRGVRVCLNVSWNLDDTGVLLASCTQGLGTSRLLGRTLQVAVCAWTWGNQVVCWADRRRHDPNRNAPSPSKRCRVIRFGYSL